MTLLHQNPELTKASQKVIPQLAEREAAWTAQQKILQAEKDEAKLQKARSAYSYLHRVTANCKKWNGPCLSVAELEAALQLAENEEYCVTQELTYYKLTHSSEFAAKRQLFRVRGVTHVEKLENLRSLLSTEEDMTELRVSVGRLPTNHDVLSTLRNEDPTQAASQENVSPHPFEILNNSIIAVVWIISDRKVWFLGCVSRYNKDDPNVAMIDHLERTVPGQNEYWRYPRIADTCEAQLNQIIGIEPRYQWEVHTRLQKLKLVNHVMLADYMARMTLE